MSTNKNSYKIFYRFKFDYKLDQKRSVNKDIKTDKDLSDFDVKDSTNNKEFNDKNITKIWEIHSTSADIKTLCSLPKELLPKNISNRKIITLRIINLKTLTEVFSDSFTQ